jgi:outer membrane protein OmpA-like peptidoglycan-associated protein
MKTKLCFFIFLVSNIVISQQGPSNLIATNYSYNNTDTKVFSNTSKATIDANGFEFELLDAGVNTEFSEIGSGFFRNKLIIVSSKKLGGFAKIDPNTEEAYKDLFCLDVDNSGQLSNPYLFSRILNTNTSEDQLSFSPDQKTVYYTRSTKENSLEFKLYKADLEEDSHGNWINNELLSINKENVSIENPFVNRAGDKLYFSSNMPDSSGGYDLYVSDIKTDGTLGTPKNLGNTVNTNLDDKYPSLSIDGKYLYFSSKGHETIGGFDLFVSKISNNGFKTPRNMGNTINSSYDEIAYFLATKNKGYVSSNRQGGKGSYDIYTATNDEVIQILKGKILDLETQIKLPNAVVTLKDEDGIEIAQTITDENGTYTFDAIVPFETYTISTQKDGFKDGSIEFLANRGTKTTYEKNIELLTTEPVIAKVEDEMRIVLENIYFDFNKYNVKEESTISLNKVIKVLKEHPEMSLAINAHTDNKGKDSYNLNLSDKRAASTVKYLIKNGISKGRLQFRGFGESKPLIDCKNDCSDEDLQANRRVEFVILEE